MDVCLCTKQTTTTKQQRQNFALVKLSRNEAGVLAGMKFSFLVGQEFFVFKASQPSTDAAADLVC